jgi:4a-hydroxytetrahydrobiopterin dehydratase
MLGMAKNKDLLKTAPRRGDGGALTPEQLAESMARLGDDWSLVDDAYLVREYAFRDFATALAFARAVGELALKLEHYPEIAVAWGRVELRTRTPRAGGPTDFDFLLAFRADKIYESS